MAPRLVRLAIVACALLIGGADLALYLDDTEGNTISSVTQDTPWLIGLTGFTAVHVSRKPDGVKRPWALTIFGAVAAAGVATLAGGGLLALVAGGALGWLCWGNSGTT